MLRTMERSWPVAQGDPIQLHASEAKLAEDLRHRLDSIFARLRSNDPIAPNEISEMGAQAHELHTLLAARGHVPKHHKHMLKNRKVAPDDREFYNHLHPVEDLLRFIANPHANDDPVDVTVGSEFQFQVYGRRWGNDETFYVTRTQSGWTFRHLHEVSTGRDARIGRKGGTGLFQLLDHESINYPEELPGYFEWLWEQAAEQGLPQAKVQEAISNLAEWISVCEKNSPAGIFTSFK